MLNDKADVFRHAVRRRWLLAALLAAVLVVVDSPVQRGYAQVTSATIMGNVIDPAGAAIPGAGVTVTNEATGAVIKTTSGPDGTYLVPNLSIAGTYAVEVGASGFNTFLQKGIVLQVNQNARIDVTLKLGSTTQRIEVTAQPPQVDTASSSLGTVISHREVEELPLNGRNPIQLVTLAAGVTTATTPAVLGWRGGSYWSSNGTRGDENQVMLNGATYEGAYFNNALNLPSPDALQEFKLITNTYSAEYGRNAGSVLNAVVKSGTNQFHGDAWDFWRNNRLNSRNFFLNAPNAKVAILNQNQFGFTAGGPIIKNKLFIFGAYQGLRIAQQSQNSGFVPTSDQLNGLFTMPAGTVLTNPATSQPFPTNAAGQYVIDPTTFNPVALKILSMWIPAPTDPTTGRYTSLASAPTKNNQFLIKGDYNFSDTNKLNFTWMRDRTQSTSPYFGGTVPTYNTETPYTHIALYTLNDTETFRPNLLNEFRASYSRLLDVLGCGKQFYANALGINSYIPDGAPENPDFGVSGYFSLSSIGLCNLSEGTPTREINDTVSWIKGNHQLKFGGSWFKNTNVIFAAYLAEGNFAFDGSFTGNALADFMLGKVSLYQRQTEGDGALISNEWAGFAEDNWKVNRKLTLNIGLRYFVQQPWYATAGGIAFTARKADGQWDPGFKTARFANAPPDVLYPDDIGPKGKIPRGMYPTPWNMWEPRIGFAWDPTGNGKTSIRASYGIFHDIVVVDAIAQAGSVQPFVYREKFPFPAGGLSDPYLGHPNPWPYRAYQSSNPQFYLPATAAALDGNTVNPFIQGWTLDIQRQLTDNWMVEASYAGKVANHLIVDMDANGAKYIPGTDAAGNPLSSLANVDQRRPFFNDGWSTISNVGSWGNASYHGLELSTQYRPRHGLSFQAGYTWSHGLDTNSNYNVGASFGAQDPYCMACEKGNSDNDRRHVFVGSFVYDIPTPFVGKQGGGHMMARNLLGKWELSGIIRSVSGGPFTCKAGASRSLSGEGQDRCDFSGSWRLPGGRSHGQQVAQWFNTAAVVENPIGTQGTSGRNMIYGPGYKNADLAVLRNFLFGERYGRLQFRAEFFNAFNFVNFNNPNGTFTSGSFGRISSAGSPRLIQLGLKYEW